MQMTKKILFISTGGTFNKQYSPETGEIEIDAKATTLMEIATKWRCDFKIITIINKDSLYMNDQDRDTLLETIKQSQIDDIIVIHGTDTIALSAQRIAYANLSKRIILTGAMIPYRVDKVEATANIAMAYGYLQNSTDVGVYISMNGVVGSYEKVLKNRELKRFELIPHP